MNKQELLNLLETYYRLLKERDREGLLSLLAPDVCVRFYGPEGSLPWVGEYRGVQGFEEFLAVIASHLEIVEVERLNTIVDDGKVVVQSRGCWRSKTTGNHIHGDMINVFTIENGRIAGYEVYNDTLAFAKGIGPAE